ncbi:unnamed protein product [Ilex paraguariensis]|uniref:Uncharacterized protein n=1 Tax=Ilex paraguariensis TaxID=185542 RepID=A0ABC8TL15_9AQUA
MCFHLGKTLTTSPHINSAKHIKQFSDSNDTE